MMVTTETWWEGIFSGPLVHGINVEKLHLLQDESFLYLSTATFEDNTQPEDRSNN
ncbi:MAG: hypothetical protein RR595_10200 [Lysinibacillus sp.]